MLVSATSMLVDVKNCHEHEEFRHQNLKLSALINDPIDPVIYLFVLFLGGITRLDFGTFFLKGA